MHEISFASAIVSTVAEIAKKHQTERVVNITLELGELTFINPEQLELAFRILAEKTAAAEAELQINKVAARIKCLKCGYEGEVKFIHFSPLMAHHSGLVLGCVSCENKGLVYGKGTHFDSPFKCPSCESENTEIVAGRECVIKRIEIA